MKTRQGFATQTGMGFEEAIPEAAARDFDFVELTMDGIHERSRLDPVSVRDCADTHDVDLLVHLPFRVDIGSPYEHVREGSIRELEAAIDTAVEMGAEKGVLHAQSRARPYEYDRSEVRENILDAVRRLDQYAPEGFEPVVENLKDPFIDAADFPHLFERTDATMCLDTGHARVTGFDEEDQADLLRAYPDRISHVHLNDTRTTGDDEHLPVGMGTTDFETIVATMRETNWTGTCTHEVFTVSYDYIEYGKAAFDRLLGA
jgi:sugar phosphate isomerase/epimerase